MGKGYSASLGVAARQRFVAGEANPVAYAAASEPKANQLHARRQRCELYRPRGITNLTPNADSVERFARAKLCLRG